ncbi:MAG: hypothetical protein DRJ98_07965 [Thermoprotei archaeon]|nr:MAG: hypothetical protein DRJ98_07965 [Thermoprotei archaeon]
MLHKGRELIIKKLSELFSRLSDVEAAILFGSTARGYKHPHDIDVAVKFSREKTLLDVASLASLIARELGVSEDSIDIIDLSEAKPLLLLKILKDGVALKGGLKELEKLHEEASRGADQLIEVKHWATLDPEPEVNKAVIASRAEDIRRNTGFIKKEVLAKNVDELDYKDVLALERALHRIAEAMLDICRHLVAVYSLGIVESYGEYPKRLAQAGKIPKELADELTKIAGLRNILVHRYLEINLDKLYEAAREIAVRITPKFIEWVKSVNS